ncbi:minor tail protein [Streptomyces phage LibertyBell]|nr:minor tail protein [Streptomyces phage LibertyBell]
MLTKVEARTRQGDLLSLPLEDDTSGYLVLPIDGLGPVKATLVSSSFAQQDGEQYHSSRRETRNIKLKLELNPDPATETVRILRRNLYNFFMPKSEVTLRFYDEEDGEVLEANITGRVESCEPDLFAQEPTVDISILCFDPDFVELAPEVISGSTTSGTTPMEISYVGTVETGIELTLNINRSLAGFTVYHVPPNDSIRTMDFANVPLVAGDVLKISTVSGAKGATLTRAGVTSSVLYGISPQSAWIELVPGVNTIRVYHGSTGADIPLAIEYVNKYGGL